MSKALEDKRKESEKKDRMIAGILAFLTFAGVVAICVFLVAFTMGFPPPGEQYVAIGWADIGDVNSATGDNESEVPSEKIEEVIEPEVSQNATEETSEEQEVVTQEESELSVPNQSNPDPNPDPEKQQQVSAGLNQAFNVLQSGGGGSEGHETSGVGNEGAQDGKIDGLGVVTGSNGDHYLDGGRLLGKPIQDQDPLKEGAVGVDIVVDKSGKVVSAKYNSDKSDTADTDLIKMAIRAAKTSKWSPDPTRVARKGFIMIRFELK
ncbi:MAG: hypothetical protein ACO3MV_05105 [Flavobacteriales bacterium]